MIWRGTNGSAQIYIWADGTVRTGVQVGRGGQVIGNGGNTGVTAVQVGMAGSETI